MKITPFATILADLKILHKCTWTGISCPKFLRFFRRDKIHFELRARAILEVISKVNTLYLKYDMRNERAETSKCCPTDLALLNSEILA